MSKSKAAVLSTVLVGMLAGGARAQPGAESGSVTMPVPEQALLTETPPAIAPPAPAQPAGPAPGSTQATFVSGNAQPWEVLLDRQPACETPCSIYVPPMRFVTLRARDRVMLEVGYLPQGSVVVRGWHFADGAYAGGIIGTTFSGMGLATGITLTAVGCATDRRIMCTAGLITGGVSAVGLYLSIRLMQSAVPKAEVLPGRPYVSGNTVGLAGTF
ncbi:MAG: hypothetical protein IPQ07_28060 [Myxococcales bacterium]|nr:hypothetical protein [Myxococcales bacterium]